MSNINPFEKLAIIGEQSIDLLWDSPDDKPAVKVRSTQYSYSDEGYLVIEHEEGDSVLKLELDSEDTSRCYLGELINKRTGTSQAIGYDEMSSFGSYLLGCIENSLED